MGKEALLASAVVRTDTVQIGAEAYTVREISAGDFALFGELGTDKKDDKGVVVEKGSKERATAHLIASCVVDETGAPLLTAEEALIVARTARVSMPLVNKVMELSGFGKEDEEQKHPDAG